MPSSTRRVAAALLLLAVSGVPGAVATPSSPDLALLQDPETLVEVVLNDPRSPPLRILSLPGGIAVCGTLVFRDAEEGEVRFVVTYPSEPDGAPKQPFYYGSTIRAGLNPAADLCEAVARPDRRDDHAAVLIAD